LAHLQDLMLLGKDNTVNVLILAWFIPARQQIWFANCHRLSSEGILETKGISPSFLIRNWPPAFKEWSTKSVRDAFFASPQFPRLTNPDLLKETISRGLVTGLLAYVGKTASVITNRFLTTSFNDETWNCRRKCLSLRRRCRGFQKTQATPPTLEPVDHSRTTTPVELVLPCPLIIPPTTRRQPPLLDVDRRDTAAEMDEFYTKVISKFASAARFETYLKVEVSPEGGLSNRARRNKISVARVGTQG